ncbi:MAG: hypothetical protein ACREAC_32635, partial [Blastocatellia bacterium]
KDAFEESAIRLESLSINPCRAQPPSKIPKDKVLKLALMGPGPPSKPANHSGEFEKLKDRAAVNRPSRPDIFLMSAEIGQFEGVERQSGARATFQTCKITREGAYSCPTIN